MKIGIIIWKLSFSGAENVANALINEFIQQGHEVELILTATKATEELIVPSYDVVSNYNNKILRIISRSINIRKIVKKNKYDVVVGFGHIDTVHMLRALIFSNIKKIGCERMDPVSYPENKLLRYERKLIYKLLDGMILQTNTQKQYYEKFLKVPLVVIPNPVRELGNKIVPVENRNKEIVTVARLEDKQKNHTFLFNCFYKFSKKHKDYILKLYGDGPDKEKYENIIKSLGMENKIFLCGKVENPQKEISSSCAFVLTSRHEGMPNALIEAMSIGLPCISVDCGGGGVKDLIIQNNNGIITEQYDEEKFILSLSNVVNNIELQKKLSKNASQINEKLCIKTIAKRWIEAFDIIIGGK